MDWSEGTQFYLPEYSADMSVEERTRILVDLFQFVDADADNFVTLQQYSQFGTMLSCALELDQIE